MKKRLIFFILISFLIFVFLIFYKSLDKSTLYEPKREIENIPKFTAKFLFENIEISTEKIFNQDKFYLLNIWASWCLPCRKEHSLLMSLSKNDELEIIGLNYKDSNGNAINFLNDLGNPYKKILIDKDGTRAIELGAFGVPETFLIYRNRIIKRFIGPLDLNMVDEIKKIIR